MKRSQDTPGQPPETIDERLRALEDRVDRLTRELAATRSLLAGSPSPGEPSPTLPASVVAPDTEDGGVVDAPGAPPVGTDTRPAPSARPVNPIRGLDIESWIGRYGALALASLTILLGVGAFLSWAVANERLGPWSRVALGASGAAALAAIGWRLRRRNSERFGSILLALALAVFHVDIWGAGPQLQLMPSSVALAMAALASAALAWLALREHDQTLFNVGFGGALLAPFVMSTALSPDAAWRLLGYGLIVLAAGLVGSHGRTWRNPPVVFVLGTFVYTAWTAWATRASTMPLALAPGLFALVCACLALAVVGEARGARTALAALMIATLFLASRVFDESVGYAIVAATTALLALAATRRDEQRRRTVLVGALLIPVATLGLSLAAIESTGKATQALVALVWAASVASFGWPRSGWARNVSVATAVLCGGAVFPIVFEERSLWLTIALSAYGAAAAGAMARLRAPGIAAGAVVWLSAAALNGYLDLVDRADYQYAPFLTMPSLGALAYSTAWIATSYRLYALVGRGPRRRVTPAGLVGLGAATVTFLWGREELSAAVSPDAAVLALVVYYALSGVSLIHLGRRWESPTLRRAGLALALYASVKAILEASQLEIGFRVGGFLLSGLFLLAVAFWYRTSGVMSPRDPPPGTVE